MKKFVLPSLVFLFAAFLSLYNIGNFPKMIGDEGIYVSQAYWLSHLGKLGPYTYWYDHFPLGWAQIGLWQILFGTTTFFNSTVLSARIFLGIILAGTSTLLYLITHHLTKSKLASFSAVLLFTTSALTQTFGRMVLLDNLAIFYLLLSLYLLLTHPQKIMMTIASALMLSVSILTKESLLFFLPPYFLLLFYLTKNCSHRLYQWVTSAITLMFFLSFFPLLAILKNELFPQPNQVSLLETILFQASRGSGTPFWQTGSHFREMLSVWLAIDPLYLFLGSLSTVLLLVFSQSLTKILSLFTLFFCLFLLRGGQIYDSYLIPLLPLFALTLTLLLYHFPFFTKSKVLTLAFPLGILLYTLSTNLYPWTVVATTAQREAINKLQALPVSTSSAILAPEYTYLDTYLLNPNTQIHWYKKADSDPSIRTKITPQYFLTDEQFSRELNSGQLPDLSNAYLQAKSLQIFGHPSVPGENSKPYSRDYLSLLSIPNQVPSNTYQTIVIPPNFSENTLQSLSPNAPYALLLTRAHFSSSHNLETIIALIKKILPNTLILTTQDSEGNNTIPWVNTESRVLFKSVAEARSATSRKAQSLSTLGFTGAIVAQSQDQDSYLQTIVEASSAFLTPFITYRGELPTFSTNLVVDNADDLQTLLSSPYQGKIFLLNQQ